MAEHKTDRKQRLKAALRDNLRKRKQQARDASVLSEFATTPESAPGAARDELSNEE